MVYNDMVSNINKSTCSISWIITITIGSLRSSLIALLSSISLLIHLLARPYKRVIANHLESIALTFHLFLAIVTTSQQSPYDTWLKIVIFFLVTIPSMLLFLTIAIIEYRLWRSNRKENNPSDHYDDGHNDQLNNIDNSIVDRHRHHHSSRSSINNINQRDNSGRYVALLSHDDS
jgi:hypothetical protein